MHAAVRHGVGDTRFDDVPHPNILRPTAIVDVTSTAICGTQVDMVRRGRVDQVNKVEGAA